MIGSPCLSVLQPIIELFQSYLGGAVPTPRPGAQHMSSTRIISNASMP